MKTISIFFTLLFVFSFLNSFSQEQIIKLKMEEGHEYFFELQKKEYTQKGNKEIGPARSQTKVLSLKVDSVESDSFIVMIVNIIKNVEEDAISVWKYRTDYIYPDFMDFGDNYSISPESFCSNTDLIFGIDLVHRKIELLNGVDLHEDYHKELVKRNSINIGKNVESFNSVYLTQITNLVEYLLWFHNVKITSDGNIIQGYLNDKLALKNKSGLHFNVQNETESKVKPGIDYKYFRVNIEDGILEKYDFIRMDSITNNFGKNVGEYLYNVSEINYELLSKGKVNEGLVKIKGEIKNSLSNKVYVRYLDEPFGVRLKKKTIYLDENGSFNTELRLKHGGFIFIENPNPNHFKPSASYTIYGDAGDSIHFSDDIKNDEYLTLFTGSKVKENILLNKIKRKLNILNSGTFFDNLQQLNYDERLNYEPIINNEPDNIPKMLNDFVNELSLAEQILAESRVNMNYFSHHYIQNEIQNYYLGVIFHCLTIAAVLERKEKLTIKIPHSVHELLDVLDLNSIYNDYGIYSRNCIPIFVKYKYYGITEINNPARVIRGFQPDLEQYIQFNRIVITGSPLYREVASLLEESTRSIYVPWKDYNQQIRDVAIDKLNLITKNCRDSEIVKKVEDILFRYNRLKNKDPEIRNLYLFNNKHKRVQLKDILKPKPTVVLFSSGMLAWSSRLDRYVEEYPQINFIRIAQGSNFREWNEYYEMAQSKAPSFLYLNDSISLDKIFLKQMVLAVFNKNGELINYYSNPESAVQSANESLSHKKGLNKSQFQTIIVILVCTLILLVFVLLIWKWRVRQRFSREQQQRRLRELELTAIRSQMNPHFLFNSLNSVQNLVQQNKGREAHLYLADFAGLIRKVLQNSEKEEVSLAEELEMTEQYLNLEKLRFDFDFTIWVDQGIDINNTMVPSMLLQPFAENAVIHGLQSKQEGRKLRIEVMREGGEQGEGKDKGEEKNQENLATTRFAHESTGIIISIEDNGIGREAAAAISKNKNGKGSKLIQERLEILQEKQGEKYSLETFDLEEGTRVEIFIPEEK